MAKIDIRFKDTFNKMEEDFNGDFKFVNGLGLINFDGKMWNFVSDNFLERNIADWLGDDFSPSNVKKYYEAYKMYNTIDVYELNKNKSIIPFTNGTFNIKTFTFEENKWYKNNYTTTGFKFDYDEKAECPTFNKYLDEVMKGDKELQAIIGEILGYCLLDDCRYERAFILYGEGATGKSVLLKTISDIWGSENCSNVPFDRLNEPFMRAGMYGKKINFSSELESDLHNTAYFKAMVSGEEIDAQFKFKDVFKFKNTAKMLFAMNNLPAIKDKSSGTYRRLVIIPFEKQFSPIDRDVDLVDKILKEKSGIINIAFNSLKKLLETNTFTYSKKSESILDEHKENNDTVCLYMNEFYTNGSEEDFAICSALYENFALYCKNNGFKALNNVNFFKRVYKLFPNSTKKRMRVNKELVYVLDKIKAI